MKTLTLGSGDTTTLAYCVKVVRRDNEVFAFTDHDNDIIIEDTTYIGGTGITTSTFKQSAGLTVDNFDLEGVIDGEIIKGSELETGLFDDAEVFVYLINWSEPTEYDLRAKGRLGDITLAEEFFKAEFKSLVSQLSQSVGKTFQRTCQAKLGDNQCKVDLETSEYKFTGTVTNVEGQSATVSGTSSYGDDWFTLGRLVSNGVTYPISGHIADDLTFWLTPYNLTDGSTVEVYAGCKQDASTCRLKFDNLDNFRGFNLMPTEDAIANYASRGTEIMDGGSLFDED